MIKIEILHEIKHIKSKMIIIIIIVKIIIIITTK